VEGVWDILSSKIDIEIIGLSELREGSTVRIGGIISNLKPIMTKKGMRMYKFTIEDISSEVEVIVFPNSAKSIPDNYFNNGEIVIISGTIAKETDEDNSSVKVYFSSCEKIDNKVLSGGKALVYKVDKNVSSVLITKIYDIIEKNNGDRPVFLELVEDKHKYMFRFNKTTNKKVGQLIQDLIDLEV
jgi:DNA polymerase-3 subunit alpha